MTEFSKKLRMYRQRANLTQDQLSEKLGDVSQKTISAYETGARSAKYPTLLELCKIFDCTVEQLDPLYQYSDIHFQDDDGKPEKYKGLSNLTEVVIDSVLLLTEGNRAKLLPMIYDLKEKQDQAEADKYKIENNVA